MPLGALKVLTEVSRHIPRRGAASGAGSRAGGHLPQIRVGGALRPMVVWGPWPDSTTVESSSGRHTRASDSSISAVVAAGQVGASDGAGEQQVAREEAPDGMSAVSGIRKVTDPLVWPGACATENSRPASSSARAVGQLLDVVRLAHGQLAHQRHADGPAERLLRVAHHVAVLGVDPGRDVVRAAHRDDRGDMVDVAVGEDDGDGLEPMLRERLLDALGGLVARVDDHALLTGGGGDQITVGPPGPGGEPGNEHDRPSCRVGTRWVVRRTCGSGQSLPALPIPQRTHIRYGAHAGGRLTRRTRPSRRTRRMRREPGGQQEQRRRQLAREKFVRQQQRRTTARRKAQARNAVIASVLGVVVVGSGGAVRDRGLRQRRRRRPTRAREADARRAAASKAPDPCEKPAAGAVKTLTWKKEPAMTIDKSAKYTMTLGRPAATSTSRWTRRRPRTR